MVAAAELDSPRLRALQRALRGHRKSAEDRFWRTVSRIGTPLVEPVEGDPEHSWVTYLWQGDPRTGAVDIFTLHRELDDFDHLTRLPGSQVWYQTAKLRNDFLGSYTFFPNPPRVIPTTAAGYYALLKRGRPDPRNPLRADSPPDPEMPDNPMYGARASALRLADAPNHRELIRQPGRPAGSLVEEHLRSRVLRNRRRIWVYTPPQEPRATERPALLIVFDGFGYIDEIPTPIILDNLWARGRAPPTYGLFVDGLDVVTRNRELYCDAAFGRFLRTELIPWSRRRLGRSFPADRTVLAGCSFGGLSAMYWAMRYPRTFGRVISQSGTFRWRPNNEDEPLGLAREFMRRPKLPLRIAMDAGRYETRSVRENGVSLLGANRHLRDVLRLKGYPVRFQQFNGGHDMYCWRQTLVDALTWVLE